MFFFKQRTAYDMRISDWSSDVCSSDLVTKRVEAVVFDVGRVIVEWDLRHLFAKLIDDAAELEWFCTHVVTEQWHFEHDAGRPLAAMLAERKAQFHDHHALLDAYANRFLETIPGTLACTSELLRRTPRAGVPLFGIPTFR